MTTRRFNYTGCRRIRRADAAVAIVPAGEHFGFEAEYDLTSYGFPPDARVVVEAYAGWSAMRFDAGTVAEPARLGTLELSEFDVPEGLLFRLKVLGYGEQAGLILGEADGLRPSEPGPAQPARSILAVRPVELGHVVWQLSFDDSPPVLLINSKVGDWQAFLRRSGIRALLVPELVRQLLRAAIDDEPDDDDGSAWQTQILRLAPSSVGPRPEAENDEAIEEWIDDVVKSVARRHDLWKGMGELLELDESA